MPHYTESQISAANHVDLAAFLISRGYKLSRIDFDFRGNVAEKVFGGAYLRQSYDIIIYHAVAFLRGNFVHAAPTL